MDGNNQLFTLAQALADPLRLVMLQQLMEGPATVSELQSLTGESQSKVSNHLALLRERDLVRATREGRQMIYTLRDASVGQLVESLTVVAGMISGQALEITTTHCCTNLLRSPCGSLWCGTF